MAGTNVIKVGKLRNAVFFRCFLAPEGQAVGCLSRLAKVAGAGPSGRMIDQKLHRVVARSAFLRQHVRSTSFSERSWKFSCSKSARGSGAKRVSKSKWETHHMFAPFLEVELLEKECAAVARSAFPSQKREKLTVPDHFLKFGCGFKWQP